MKNNLVAIILAGGLGSRLLPLTQITNKHLLPVWNKPMIYYPIEQLVAAGISEICLITGGYHAGDFLRLLKNGEQFGLSQLSYRYQNGEGGIADALALAQSFAGDRSMVVYLGDNIFSGSIKEYVDCFKHSDREAMVVLSTTDTPERFGCPKFSWGEIAEIVEKPIDPTGFEYAVTGLYMYTSTVWDNLPKSPSARGEFEITDVNNAYARKGQLDWIEHKGWWTDAGTFESLYRATMLVRDAEMTSEEIRH